MLLKLARQDASSKSLLGCKVSCFNPEFAPPLYFNAGIMTDYVCIEGSTYQLNVKLIKTGEVYNFFWKLKNKIDSSFKIEVVNMWYTSAGSHIAHKISATAQ